MIFGFYKRFTQNANEALIFLGFADRTVAISESLHYLRRIAATFVKKLSLNPNIEVLREKIVVEIEEEEIKQLLRKAPYLKGGEYFDQTWIEDVWETLNQEFGNIIQIYKGSVEELFAAYNPSVHLMGRVFFHLVESKKEEYPFAFLATYSANVSSDGKSRHLPLKNAIAEYGQKSRKLLDLLSTVNKATEKSAFISELVESGEIFHPLSLTAEEAYTFLKEIPVYEVQFCMGLELDWTMIPACFLLCEMSILRILFQNRSVRRPRHYSKNQK